jgi:hypothetical protein
MTLAQLTGRRFRLRQELAAAYGALPWNTRRIDRLSKDIARTDRDIACVQEGAAPEVQPILCPHSSHAWLAAFAAHLIQLRPSMNAASAVRHAVACFHHAEDLDPLLAAELLVSGDPFVKPAPAGARVARREQPSARYEAMFAAYS